MGFRNCIFFILLLVTIPFVKAQDEKFKALFMYNFTKYLEWPDSKQKGDFIIGVYGNSPIITELNIIAGKRKIKEQTLVIKKIFNTNELTQCNIVYIPENHSNEAGKIAGICQNKGIVIITDKAGYAKLYSGLNYVKINGKLNFEINRKHLEDEGIVVNAALLSLGIIVE